MHVCDSEPIIVAIDFPVLYNYAFNIIVTVQTRYILEAMNFITLVILLTDCTHANSLTETE